MQHIGFQTHEVPYDGVSDIHFSHGILLGHAVCRSATQVNSGDEFHLVILNVQDVLVECVIV